MRIVYLDTVGLLALWDEADQWHGMASSAIAEIQRGPCRFVTTTFVMLE
jgi:predicted nucleic acid-binding protein